MQNIEAFQLVLADLIREVGLVIPFSALAQILGEDPQTLRVRECRARAKGIELLPLPLPLGGKERQWSAVGVAAWLCETPQLAVRVAMPTVGVPQAHEVAVPTPRGRGRPRKGATANSFTTAA